MIRRAFLGGTLSAIALGTCKPQSATTTAQSVAAQMSPEPLVWPVATKLQPGIRSFSGHTDTVPDIVGRIGTPASLAIFTEGNHLMAILSEQPPPLFAFLIDMSWNTRLGQAIALDNREMLLTLRDARKFILALPELHRKDAPL